MPEILIPFTFEDLPVKPPLKGRPRISEDLQQTLALLSGWDGATRRLIRCSASGILRTAPPQVKGLLNILADQDAYTTQGSDIKTTEVMIRAFPDNTGRVFLNIGIAAALNTGYPLFTGEWVNISLNNLNIMYLYVEKDTDKVAIIYSV